MSTSRFEIDSLNVDDLDVEELQARLEMAMASGMTSDSWFCSVDSACEPHCHSNCDAVCTGNCSAVCDVHCGAVR